MSILSEFLRKEDGFVFYADDYMLGSRHSELLSRKIRRFEDAQRAGRGVLNEKTVVRYYNAVKRRIPARRDGKSIARLSQLEIISPRALGANPEDHFSISSDVLWKKNSSGTSGRPLEFLFSEQFFVSELFLTHKKIASFIKKDIDRNVTFCGIINSGTWKDFVLPDIFDDRLFCRVYFDERSKDSIRNLWKRLCRIEPYIVAMKSSYLELFVSSWQPCWGSPPFRVISLSGDSADHRLQELARDLWDVTFVNVYATTEFGIVGIKGPHCDGHHVDSSSFYVEEHVSAETDNGVESILVSTMSNSVMPAFRYVESGVRLGTEFCRCGRKSPLMSVAEGRKSCLVRLNDGEYLDSTRLSALYSCHTTINRVELDGTGGDLLRIRVVTSQEPAPSLKDAIERALEQIVPLSRPENLRCEVVFEVAA